MKRLTTLLIGPLAFFCLLGTSTTFAQVSKGDQRLYRIEIEDADEAALIAQQLKIKPVLVRDRWFYYYGNDELNRRLNSLGYKPSPQNPDEILTRVARIGRKGQEERLRELGVTILLRERTYWIVNGTIRALRSLRNVGYAVADVRVEPRPRLVHVTVKEESVVKTDVATRIDIHTVQRTREGYLVVGGAFDYAIDELRAAGFKVEIVPNP